MVFSEALQQLVAWLSQADIISVSVLSAALAFVLKSYFEYRASQRQRLLALYDEVVINLAALIVSGTQKSTSLQDAISRLWLIGSDEAIEAWWKLQEKIKLETFSEKSREELFAEFVRTLRADLAVRQVLMPKKTRLSARYFFPITIR